MHGLGAQSTCGNIGDPQQADVVVRVDQNLEKSQDILDLSTIEVTLAAHKSIGDFRLPQGCFQRSGLKIGAKENGLVIPWNPFAESLDLDAFGNRLSLSFLGLENHELNERPLSLAGPKGLVLAQWVVSDHGIGCLENGVIGAVILFQLDDSNSGKVILEVKQIGNLGSPPTVDTLIIIADNADILMFACQSLEQLKLLAVGVLIFVHHDVAMVFTTGFEDFFVGVEKFQHQ